MLDFILDTIDSVTMTDIAFHISLVLTITLLGANLVYMLGGF